jgi:hypothetical protein
MSEESCQTIITCAVVHQEQTPAKSGDLKSQIGGQFGKKVKCDEDTIDEVDCTRYNSVLDLPPYPSPPSTCHSRQASEDFPPPPPDLISLSSQLSSHTNNSTSSSNSRCTNIELPEPMRDSPSHMLIQLLQSQHQQQSASELSRSEIWLRELQSKQIALKQKKGIVAPVEDPNVRSVRDLASRFEQTKLNGQSVSPAMNAAPNLTNSGKMSASQELLNKPQPSNIRTGKFRIQTF